MSRTRRPRRGKRPDHPRRPLRGVCDGRDWGGVVV